MWREHWMARAMHLLWETNSTIQDPQGHFTRPTNRTHDIPLRTAFTWGHLSGIHMSYTVVFQLLWYTAWYDNKWLLYTVTTVYGGICMLCIRLCSFYFRIAVNYKNFEAHSYTLGRICWHMEKCIILAYTTCLHKVRCMKYVSRCIRIIWNNIAISSSPTLRTWNSICVLTFYFILFFSLIEIHINVNVY